jgi:signal peptide peptidase SppA
MARAKNRLSEVSMTAMSRMNLRDMLVLPDTATQTMTDLTRFYETEATTEAAALELGVRESLEAAYGFDRQPEEDRKPFVYQDGVAVIPIHGTLLNRCNWSWGFVTGYQYIRRMLNAALEDGDVEAIVFDVDSPGGEASGCFELAREIMASRRVKPSLAMVDSVAASGGMALAGAATIMYAIPSARVGSIGVYRMHVSYEGAHKQAGIKVTFAAAGEHKVDGNPYEDLPKAVLDEWRESAGKTWDDFIALVAEARDMSEDDVRATQARIYRADEALAKGLINAVKTPTEAIGAFLAELAEDRSPNEDEEESTMADATGKPNKEVTSALTEADLKSIATIAAQAAAGVVGSMLGKSERKTAIKDHAAGFGKAGMALAKTIIDNEAIDADAGIAMLDAAFGGKKAKKAKVTAIEDDEDDDDALEGDDEDGEDDESEDDDDDGEDDEDGEEAARVARSKAKVKAKAPKDKVNHFDKAMKGSKQPNVGGGKAKAGGGDNGGSRASGVNPLLADHAKVTGANWSAEATKSKH